MRFAHRFLFVCTASWILVQVGLIQGFQENADRVAFRTAVGATQRQTRAADEKVRARVRTRDGKDHEGNLANQTFS